MDPVSLIKDFFEISESWAQVYYQLLLKGPGSIKKFKTNLNFNRQQIYNILDRLVDLNFVVIISQSKRGNVYQAILPENLLKSYLHRLEVHLQKKKESSDEFLIELNRIFFRFWKNNGQEPIFHGKVIPREKIGITLKNLINSTLNSFKIVVRDLNQGLMAEIQPTIIKAMQRKTITIQLLICQESFNPSILKRFLDGTWFSSKVVADWIKNERLMIKLSPYIKQNYFLFDDVALMFMMSGVYDIDFAFVNEMDNLTLKLLQKFNLYWEKATNINKLQFPEQEINQSL